MVDVSKAIDVIKAIDVNKTVDVIMNEKKVYTVMVINSINISTKHVIKTIDVSI